MRPEQRGFPGRPQPFRTWRRAVVRTNLYVELQVLVHGKYMFKYVLRYPGDDSHAIGIVKAPLPEESRRVESAQRRGINAEPETQRAQAEWKQSRQSF